MSAYGEIPDRCLQSTVLYCPCHEMGIYSCISPVYLLELLVRRAGPRVLRNSSAGIRIPGAVACSTPIHLVGWLELVTACHSQCLAHPVSHPLCFSRGV